MHLNCLHEHGLRHERRYFGFEETHLHQRRFAHEIQELAFFLATYNYRAVPKDGCVEVDLNGRICKLIPNGNEPGLCDISPEF
jgi:hypothetical protein